MPDTNEQRDPVEAAKHLLNHPGWREPFGSDARRIVMELCDEVDRLRTQNQTQAESITYFQENEKSLKAQLVNAVIPYEALLLDVESRKWIAPSIWKEIESTVTTIRAEVKGKNL